MYNWDLQCKQINLQTTSAWFVGKIWSLRSLWGYFRSASCFSCPLNISEEVSVRLGGGQLIRERRCDFPATSWASNGKWGFGTAREVIRFPFSSHNRKAYAKWAQTCLRFWIECNLFWQKNKYFKSNNHVVMGGQLGLLGHMGPSTVASRYCSAASTLGFVRDKIRSLRGQVSHSI